MSDSYWLGKSSTGIWALDFAEKYPSITVECLDANLEALPPQSWLPSNVTSRQFDLLQDIPDDLVGIYQIIHIQYIMAFVLDSNIDNVVQSLLKMLKPGGYLQWTETNINRYSWVTGTGEVPVETHKLFETLRKFIAQRGESRLWLNDFEGLLQRAGFQNAVYSAPEPRSSTLQPVMMNWIWGIEEGFGYLATRSLPSEMKILVENCSSNGRKLLKRRMK
ncbi:hypothetical protein PRZ48_003918 [Zasmidium cellare]|uniref:Uncharacterized protein n=1 Tax=Zasmidium cellare TaxID=395010 RepID=A0ABR0EXP5_ZASCE|nr:hypothetical protein PRZ48_003918 [Zasmidium cellare]